MTRSAYERSPSRPASLVSRPPSTLPALPDTRARPGSLPWPWPRSPAVSYGDRRPIPHRCVSFACLQRVVGTTGTPWVAQVDDLISQFRGALPTVPPVSVLDRVSGTGRTASRPVDLRSWIMRSTRRALNRLGPSVPRNRLQRTGPMSRMVA